MHDPVETSELLAFSTTVDAKSLSRAALELGVPRATVSRRLARLEERLGARLLRRTTRRLVLTDAGEALYLHARIVLDAVKSAEASVRRTDDVVRGDLRVSVPPLAMASFNAMICDFCARYPELRVHVHYASQHVDLVRGGFDVALRASMELEPGLVARTLARMPILAVASPAYLAAHGEPKTARDLKHHRCIMGFARGEVAQSHWPVAGGGRLHVEGTFFSNDIGMLAAAATRGQGIAMVPRFSALPGLESGALVQVLPKVLRAESRLAVVYAEREFVPPQVRAFVDAVVAWAPSELSQTIPERCKDSPGKRRPGATGGATTPRRRRG